MNYDSVVVTGILVVEMIDFWIHYRKEREAQSRKIKRLVNRFLKEARHGSRATAR